MTKIQMHDDSMQPRIEKGDILVIDTEPRTVQNGSVYLCNTGNDILIRRIRKEKNGYTLQPDNKHYKKVFIPFNSALTILGRVAEIRREV